MIVVSLKELLLELKQLEKYDLKNKDELKRFIDELEEMDRERRRLEYRIELLNKFVDAWASTAREFSGPYGENWCIDVWSEKFNELSELECKYLKYYCICYDENVEPCYDDFGDIQICDLEYIEKFINEIRGLCNVKFWFSYCNGYRVRVVVYAYVSRLEDEEVICDIAWSKYFLSCSFVTHYRIGIVKFEFGIYKEYLECFENEMNNCRCGCSE